LFDPPSKVTSNSTSAEESAVYGVYIIDGIKNQRWLICVKWLYDLVIDTVITVHQK